MDNFEDPGMKEDNIPSIESAINKYETEVQDLHFKILTIANKIEFLKRQKELMQKDKSFLNSISNIYANNNKHNNNNKPSKVSTKKTKPNGSVEMPSIINSRKRLDERSKSFLESIFDDKPYPNGKEYVAISKELGLDVVKIKSWFHNRRKKKTAAEAESS